VAPFLFMKPKYSFKEAVRSVWRNKFDVIHDVGAFTTMLGCAVTFMGYESYDLNNMGGKLATLSGIAIAAAGSAMWGHSNNENYEANELNREFENIVRQIDSSNDPGYNDPK